MQNRLCTPKDYARTFKQLGIDSVIRLNSPTYDRREFVESSISHHDLYFMDGTSPPKDVLDKFFKTVECERVFGIHCKAGLGRTGCLIGCYAMKHYFFSAAYFIAWIRLCRPGSILGPQQHFLISMEKEMKEAGIASPIWK
jgi:cell division cycle 14